MKDLKLSLPAAAAEHEFVMDTPAVTPVNILVEDGRMVICVPEDADRAAVTINGVFCKEDLSAGAFKRLYFPAPTQPVFVEVVVSYKGISSQDVFRQMVEPQP